MFKPLSVKRFFFLLNYLNKCVKTIDYVMHTLSIWNPNSIQTSSMRAIRRNINLFFVCIKQLIFLYNIPLTLLDPLQKERLKVFMPTKLHVIR